MATMSHLARSAVLALVLLQTGCVTHRLWGAASPLEPREAPVPVRILDAVRAPSGAVHFRAECTDGEVHAYDAGPQALAFTVESWPFRPLRPRPPHGEWPEAAPLLSDLSLPGLTHGTPEPTGSEPLAVQPPQGDRALLRLANGYLTLLEADGRTFALARLPIRFAPSRARPPDGTLYTLVRLGLTPFTVALDVVFTPFVGLALAVR